MANFINKINKFMVNMNINVYIFYNFIIFFSIYASTIIFIIPYLHIILILKSYYFNKLYHSLNSVHFNKYFF
jgi:hypothetical protein